jgi:hypothetical protein
VTNRNITQVSIPAPSRIKGRNDVQKDGRKAGRHVHGQLLPDLFAQLASQRQVVITLASSFAILSMNTLKPFAEFHYIVVPSAMEVL